MQHASFFNYNLQRPYPLRWFTPVAIVGGVIITVLISFANFVASGYELTTIYASDPGTIDEGLWFKQWPSWLRNNINATCEPANLPVNSQFFTNKTALAYTLSSIAIEKDGVVRTSQSLPYLNNVMDKCEVTNITMDFDCSPTGNPTQMSYAGCRIDTRAFVTCAIDGPNGRTTFNSTSLYNPYLPYNVPGSSNFISQNASSLGACLWWAQQMLTANWFDTNIVTYDNIGNDTQSFNTEAGIQQGSANFFRHPGKEDISKLDFFDAHFNFHGLINGAFYYPSNNLSVETYVEEPNVADTQAPPIWEQADRLAKSMYSAVMTDLGQTKLASASNLVIRPDVLETYSERFIPLHNRDYSIGIPTLNDQIPDASYGSLRQGSGAGALEVTPSVISTNYLCSVPRMKSAGNIFVSILLADLVFLNLVWVIYCLVVERFFIRSPTANYCEGCLNGVNDVHPLRDIRKSNASSVPSIAPLGFDSSSFSTGYEPVHLQRTDSHESLVGTTRRSMI